MKLSDIARIEDADVRMSARPQTGGRARTIRITNGCQHHQLREAKALAPARILACLTGARGHLGQEAIPALCNRRLQPVDRFHLVGTWPRIS